MEGGHQRRAMAAGGDVAATEIGDRGDAAAFGDDVAVAHLPGEGSRLTIRGPVAHGLPVRADRAHLRRRALPARRSPASPRRRRRGPDARIQLAEFVERSVASPPWPSATRRARSAVIPGIGAAEAASSAVRRRNAPARHRCRRRWCRKSGPGKAGRGRQACGDRKRRDGLRAASIALPRRAPQERADVLDQRFLAASAWPARSRRCRRRIHVGVDDVLDRADARQRIGGLGAERSQLRAGQRFRRRHRDGQRIAVHAVDAEFVMQVRAGGQAGGAHVTDHRALARRAGPALILPKRDMCPYSVV